MNEIILIHCLFAEHFRHTIPIDKRKSPLNIAEQFEFHMNEICSTSLLTTLFIWATKWHTYEYYDDGS